jgi:hypothetical protein
MPIAMRLPVIKGLIRRRLLVNFRADPAVVQRLLPAPFRPKLHRGFALVGVCLIRLERIRPAGLPGWLGLASENAAHRIAVEWADTTGAEHEGVFIPRRDSGSLLNRLAGGRLFPGEHHPARFEVTDDGSHIELTMRSHDGVAAVRVVGDDADTLPAGSCFGSVAEASAFFEGGSLGFSVTRDGDRLDALRLETPERRLRALAVVEASSSYFADEQRFPPGTVEYDHALIMRDLAHVWRPETGMLATPAGVAA